MFITETQVDVLLFTELTITVGFYEASRRGDTYYIGVVSSVLLHVLSTSFNFQED